MIPPSQTTTRVALYARFSSDNQRSESIDAQVRAMRTYCQQHNYTIVHTYVDEAKSATTDRRPAFQQMIADSGKHGFDILLVHKLDRFARDRYDSAVYKRELKKNGVTVYSVLENLDNTPESIMLEAVLEGMSEYYSQNLAREVMKGMRETALQGKHTGGRPPLGYAVDPVTKKLVIDEDEAEIVRLIFSMCAEGYTYSAILDALRERGMRTRSGIDFCKNSLHDLLINPKYRGTYSFNLHSGKNSSGSRNNRAYKDPKEVITIEGGCPAIVDAETFEAVQRRIAARKNVGQRYYARETYLLTGKVYCRDCGKAMVGNSRHCGRSKQLYVTYRCPTRRHSCSNSEINRDKLEGFVVDLLEKQMLNPASIRQIQANLAEYEEHPLLTGNRQAYQQELDEVEQALQNIADAVAAGMYSDTLLTRLNDLEQRQQELEDCLKKACTVPPVEALDPQNLLREYLRLKSTPSSPDYARLIRSCIEHIYIGRYSVSITLKTDLGLHPELDQTYEIRRQDIYQRRTVG